MSRWKNHWVEAAPFGLHFPRAVQEGLHHRIRGFGVEKFVLDVVQEHIQFQLWRRFAGVQSRIVRARTIWEINAD